MESPYLGVHDQGDSALHLSAQLCGVKAQRWKRTER
jgi:hypothetical protein